MNKALFDNFAGEIRYEEPLAKHTTWRVGGPASVMVFPTEAQSLANLIRNLRNDQIAYTVIGNGSNLLAPDQGFNGVVINLRRGFAKIDEIAKSEKEVVLEVGAGVSKYRLLQHALINGYINLVFLAGIPGTVGGGLAMNAGTREGAFDAVTEAVTVIDRAGNLVKLEKNNLRFGYRTGIRAGVIVTCTLRSKTGSPEDMKTRMSQFMKMRKETQPLTFPSCGSTFKNPDGDSAGRLIEAAGLKGHKVGDAQVSLRHANFIVNLGKATATDIETLIAHIKEDVKTKFGVNLSEEVQRLEAH